MILTRIMNNRKGITRGRRRESAADVPGWLQMRGGDLLWLPWAGRLISGILAPARFGVARRWRGSLPSNMEYVRLMPVGVAHVVGPTSWRLAPGLPGTRAALTALGSEFALTWRV